MVIDANTKIAALIKSHPEALDAIISITPKFQKLRNPLLRKLMAGRTSIAMASKISGCGVSAFYEKLRPLGFEVNESIVAEEEKPHPVPAFLHTVKAENIVTLDVRPIIESGKDPLKNILQAVKEIPDGGALKIINSFEPTPLISLLQKQGYNYFVDRVDADVVETWFYKNTSDSSPKELDIHVKEEGWDEMINKFQNALVEIDVRHLQMPMPMHTILESLDDLQPGKALYVNHKRIPVFLLPELKERGFDYRIKEISDGDVRLLIFKE